MRALIVGGGALGARRARIIQELGAKAYHLDVFPTLVPEVTVELLSAHLSGWPPREQRLDTLVIVCTPPETIEPVLDESRRAGVGAVFIEQLQPSDLERIARLRKAASGLTIMVGCPMRFAYQLPSSTWALLDIIRRQAPLCPSGFGMPANFREELDLAYGVNGRFRSVHQVVRPGGVTLVVGHENMATTQIEVQLARRGLADRCVILNAYDDGRAITVLHEPITIQPDIGDLMYRRELAHFMECVRIHKQPVNSLDDAEHVLHWLSRLEDATNDSGYRSAACTPVVGDASQETTTS